MNTHETYMRRCFELAKQGEGNVAPNPMVGAVLVFNDVIIGEGYHSEFGKEHAEVNCIVNASQNLYGCTMFCWCPLPCIECTKIIINAGIKEVHCFKEPKDYSVGSRYLFEKAGVNILEYNKEDFN